MSEAGEIVGMVDVLKLTYATLDQACGPTAITNSISLTKTDQHNADWRWRRSSLE